MIHNAAALRNLDRDKNNNEAAEAVTIWTIAIVQNASTEIPMKSASKETSNDKIDESIDSLETESALSKVFMKGIEKNDKTNNETNFNTNNKIQEEMIDSTNYDSNDDMN